MTIEHSEIADNQFRLHYEPIAIIGIGCRFPGGANDPESFWKLLSEGTDAVSEIPPTRWDVDKFFDPSPAAAGKIYTRHGGFIDNIDQFDCGFFGISPREAMWMDPQQRLLLKIAWEAIEDAGMIVDRDKKQSTGVFVGASSLDYARSISSATELAELETHTGTGIAFSILANRISHRLNLAGPSMVVDTACSSSMVAINLACRSLWLSECETALAGGCNLILHPEMYVLFSRLALLSPEGRSKAFSESGNGFVRAEGAGLILLKPLSRALQDKNPIYAVIRGIGVNQDGYTPEALTFPSGEAQKALMENVYKRFTVNPRDITYVEAHGTGTYIGDPIEANAIGDVIGSCHTHENPCFMGSVKTNIGHMESGAGIAGIIKAALMIRHRKIAPNLHFDTPNPEIDFDGLKLKVPRELMDWPAERPVAVAINSFGFGGTNAHAVLSKAPVKEEIASCHSRDAELFCLSAHTLSSLYAYAERCLAYMNKEHWRAFHLQDICRAAINRRFPHKHRLSIACTSREQLAERLNKFCHHETSAGIYAAEALPESQHKVVFVFSGQGANWHGMGQKLFSGEPVFREAIERCHEIFQTHASWSLIDELHKDEQHSRLDNTAIAQPILFSIQVALTALWASWGIRPAAVVGHSLGEITAAYISGSLSLEDAIRIVYYRSYFMSKAGEGKMLAVGLDNEAVGPYLQGYANRVELAALNTQRSVTLSGDTDAIEELEAIFSASNVFCRLLDVRYPFHSHRMDPIRDEFLAAIGDISIQKPHTLFYSTVKGREVDPTDFTSHYWWDNIRQTVLFAPAINQIIDHQYKVFIEIGPHPVLNGLITQCALIREYKAIVAPSLQRDQNERLSLLSTLGVCHDIGIECNWKSLYPDTGLHVPFPAYAWDDEPYWQQTDTMRNFLRPKGHPLLGRRLSMPEPAWENHIHEYRLPYLKDHRVHGHCLFPGAAYIEMAIAAVHEINGFQHPVLENLKLERAIFLSDSTSHVLQSFYKPALSTLQVYGREEKTDSAWKLNASCSVIPAQHAKYSPIRLDDIQTRCTEVIEQHICYKKLNKLGFQYGPGFQGIEKVYRGDGEALAKIAVAECLHDDMEKYHAHPAILDACLQTVIATGTLDSDKSYLPVHIDRFHLAKPLKKHMWSYVYAIEKEGMQHKSSVLIADDQGSIIAQIHGLQLEGIPVSRVPAARFEDILYNYRWIPDHKATDYGGDPLLLSLPLNTIASQTQHFFSKLESAFPPDGIDELCCLYVVQALSKMGMKFQPGETFNFQNISDSLKIAQNQQPFFERLLDMLFEDGFLSRNELEWQILSIPTDNDAQKKWRTLMLESPSFYPELALLAKQADSLPAILRNEIDPDDLLSKQNDFGLYEHLYRDALFLSNYNMAIRFAMEKIIAALPRRRNLRILEVGAGTGGTAAYVLPLLSADEHEYFFTDLRDDYLQISARKFQTAKNVHYMTLDIDSDPKTQDIDHYRFDIIISVHTLCVTGNARQCLAHIKHLLAPSGVFMLVEPKSHSRWTDLAFGRMFHDTSWQDCLAESGFDDISHIHCSSSNTPWESSLFMARRPVLEAVSPRVYPRSEKPGTWLIFCDQHGSGLQVAKFLNDSGDRSILVSQGNGFRQTAPDSFTIAPTSADDMTSLIAAVWPSQPRAPFSGILHMWSLDINDNEELSTSDIEDIYGSACINVLLLTQALPLEKDDNLPPLWLITRCTQSLDNSNQTISPFQAPLWGLGRVIETELPGLRCTKVDLGAETPEDETQELRLLIDEFYSDVHEDEIALRGNLRYVNRLQRTSVNKIARKAPKPDDEYGFRLETPGDGVINHLTLRRAMRPEPGPSEVLIEVQAAGLNFSDVMKALNLYPGLPEGETPLGIECAGIVVETGSEVIGRQCGDRVIAVGQFCFSSHVLTHESLVMDMPDRMRFAEAATIPVAFLTAHYALVNMGRLQQGERVLIHSATGGVGQAAIQIARNVGAEIFATAGTPEKRQLLRDMGIKWVMDSRTLDFADEIMAHTHGEGVDVILNSLSGQAIARGLSILKHHGRFLEIGKRDIYQDSPIGLLPFQKNLSFCAIDLDSVIRKSADTIQTIQHDCYQALQQGTYSPLPFRAFPVERAAEAFRYMSQARHFGKIVLTFKAYQPQLAPPMVDSIAFRRDATYLIVGGFGGYGLLLAKWLVENGARHLALIGRHGANTAAAQAVLIALRHKGAQVKEIQADVACENDVVRVIKDLKRTMPPLRGIAHLAMVLKDKVITDLTISDMTAVMDSKIKGAWLLHRHTQMMALDFFLMFSSMTSLTGTRGQANYAAANAFLDAFAHYRTSKGLPGLAINWGALGDAGRVAQDKKLADWFDSAGVKSIPAAQVLRALNHMLQLSAVQAAVMDIDWGNLGNIIPVFRESKRFEHLYHVDANSALDDAEGIKLASVLRNAADSERTMLLQTAIVEQIAKILGAKAENLELEKPLTQFGLDSLMVMELGNWISKNLNIALPIIEIIRGPSIEQLTQVLLKEFLRAEIASEPSTTSTQTLPGTVEAESPGNQIDDSIDGMPEDQLDAMLEQMQSEGTTDD